MTVSHLNRQLKVDMYVRVLSDLHNTGQLHNLQKYKIESFSTVELHNYYNNFGLNTFPGVFCIINRYRAVLVKAHLVECSVLRGICSLVIADSM